MRLSLSLSKFFLPQATQQQCLDGPDPVWNINVDQALPPVCPKFDRSYWVLVMHLLSVGHARLLSAFQRFFSCRRLYGNALTGTIPPQISTLTKLIELYAPKWHIHWVLVICFIECWNSCEPSLLFYLVLVHVFEHFSFDECWLECFVTHDFKVILLLFRDLTDTQIEPQSCRQGFGSKAEVQKFFKNCIHGMATIATSMLTVVSTWPVTVGQGILVYWVLVMCLLLAFQSFFCHRKLYDNALTGTASPMLKWHSVWSLQADCCTMP